MYLFLSFKGRTQLAVVWAVCVTGTSETLDPSLWSRLAESVDKVWPLMAGSALQMNVLEVQTHQPTPGLLNRDLYSQLLRKQAASATGSSLRTTNWVTKLVSASASDKSFHACDPVSQGICWGACHLSPLNTVHPFCLGQWERADRYRVTHGSHVKSRCQWNSNPKATVKMFSSTSVS